MVCVTIHVCVCVTPGVCVLGVCVCRRVCHGVLQYMYVFASHPVCVSMVSVVSVFLE